MHKRILNKNQKMSPTANFLVQITRIMIITITTIISTTSASIGSLIYCGCTQLHYGANTQYQSNINSLLTSLATSATMATSYYTKLTVGTNTPNVVYGLYQCRPDINPSDCAACVANSLSQLGSRCSGSTGGAIQLDGCFLKYDNRSFFGVEDKTVVEKGCGPPVGYDSGELTQVDSVLGYLGGGGGLFRVGGTGAVQGVAECVGDLSGGQCQDCLTAAVAVLRGGCAGAAWGDAFLGTCYARFSVKGSTGSYSAPNSVSSQNNNETDEDLAILIGIVVGVTLIVFFIAYYRRSRDQKEAGGK